MPTEDALDGMTPAELDAMEAKMNGVEAEADEVVEGAADETGEADDGDTETVTTTTTTDDERPARYVPVEELAGERKKRQALELEVERLKGNIEGRTAVTPVTPAVTAKKVDDDPMPDPVEELEAFKAWQDREMDRKVEARMTKIEAAAAKREIADIQRQAASEDHKQAIEAIAEFPGFQSFWQTKLGPWIEARPALKAAFGEEDNFYLAAYDYYSARTGETLGGKTKQAKGGATLTEAEIRADEARKTKIETIKGVARGGDRTPSLGKIPAAGGDAADQLDELPSEDEIASMTPAQIKEYERKLRTST